MWTTLQLYFIENILLGNSSVKFVNPKKKTKNSNDCDNDAVISLFSTSCSTSSCTTSPYVIFETNTLPYVQRTLVSERDTSNVTACIDDSGGGGDPIDNNNIGDDDTDNNGNDQLLKRNSISVLQRHSFESVEHVIEHENEDDDDDDEASGIYGNYLKKKKRKECFGFLRGNFDAIKGLF